MDVDQPCLNRGGGGEPDNSGEDQTEKHVQVQATSTEGNLIKKRGKPKKKTAVAVDPKLEELYNKTLHESGIDTDGMEWEEKKELSEVLLLSKDETQSTDKSVEVDTESGEGYECERSENKLEILVSENSRVDVAHHHSKQSVPSCPTAAQSTGIKLRKRPFDEMLDENKITVSVDVHTEDDEEKPIQKKKRLRQWKRRKVNVQEQIVAPRKKTRAAGGRNKKADDITMETSRESSDCLQTASTTVLQDVTSKPSSDCLQTASTTVLQDVTSKPSSDCLQTASTTVLQDVTSKPSSDCLQTASTTVLQEVTSKPSSDSCFADPSQSITSRDVVVELSSGSEHEADVGSSPRADCALSELPGEDADKNAGAVMSHCDIDDDDDETQPPDSPDLFRDQSVPIQIQSVAETMDCGGNEHTLRGDRGGNEHTLRGDCGGNEHTLRGDRGGNEHTLRGDHGGNEHTLRGDRGGNEHTLRGDRGGNEHTLRGDCGGNEHTLRGDCGGNEHTLRGDCGGNEHTLRGDRGGNEHTLMGDCGGNEHTLMGDCGGNEHTLMGDCGGNEHTLRGDRGGNEHTLRGDCGGNEHTLRADRGGNGHTVMGDRGESRVTMESEGNKELSTCHSAHKGIPASSRTTRTEQPEQNYASQEPNIINEESQGFETSEGEGREMEEESQSPKFKKRGTSLESTREFPDEKLLRKYRKYKEKIRLTAPLFTPPSQDPVTYAKVILQLFDLYLRNVRLAQSEISAHVDWGVSVPVGRHMSRTLDIKRRGQSSFCWSDDSETQEDNEPQKHNSQTKEESPVESLPDIPSVDPLADTVDLCAQPTEYVPLESTLQNEQSEQQTLDYEDDDDVYNADTEEAFKGSSQGVLMEPRSFRNAAATANEDSNVTTTGSQSSNSILNSQGEIKPYQKQADEKKDLIKIDEAVNIVDDSDTSESSNSSSVKKWTTLAKGSKKIIAPDDSLHKPELIPKNKNSDVKIMWSFDNEIQQMKRVVIKTDLNALAKKKDGESIKELDEDVKMSGSSDFLDDAALKKVNVKPITRSLNFLKQGLTMVRRTLRSPLSAQRNRNINSQTSSDSDPESPVHKRSWKKSSRKSFQMDDSDNSIPPLESASSPVSAATATAGKSASHTCTSLESDSAVIAARNEAHQTEDVSYETVNHVACPLCNEFFNSSHIEAHASECDGPVIQHQTRKRKHDKLTHQLDHNEDLQLRDEDAVEIAEERAELSRAEDRTDARAVDIRRQHRWESDEVDLSAVRKRVVEMNPRQTETCMICSEAVPAGRQYEQHVDRCIQAAIEKNNTDNDSGNRRCTRSRVKGSLIGELESTWDQPDRTDTNGLSEKENSTTSMLSRHSEEVPSSSNERAASKEPNWLNTELDSPIKSFKRISELEHRCMDFENQFKAKDKGSGNKGQWKYLGRGRKRQRKK